MCNGNLQSKETCSDENIFVFLMSWATHPLELVLWDRRWRDLIFLDPSKVKHKISTLLVSV